MTDIQDGIFTVLRVEMDTIDVSSLDRVRFIPGRNSVRMSGVVAGSRLDLQLDGWRGALPTVGEELGLRIQPLEAS